MPIIQEEELNNLHSEIRSQKNKITDLEDDIKDLSESNEEIEKHRLLLSIAASILLLFVLLGIGTYLFSPKTFMNKAKFESHGYKVMSIEEFDQMKEILDAQSTDSLTEENNAEEEDYYKDNNQQSIDDTVIYAVQVGAFEEGGIELYSNNLIQFTEVRKDDFYKYSLGAFETLEEAQTFRKEIVRLGFKDAFVASYKNGKRLRIEEAY